MRKLVVLAALAALAVPANVAAKEISGAKVCGPRACVTTTDKAALLQLSESSAPSSELPPAPAPYYRIRLQVSEPGHGVVAAWDEWFVPSANAIVARGESGTPQWSRAGRGAVAFLQRTTRSLAPYATPRFTRVLVGAHPVRDPASYRALFDPSWKVVYDSAGDWEPITIDASARNPWTDGVQLVYSPSRNMLWFGVDRVHVPARIAANVEARRSLLTASERPSRAWAWAAGGAALAGGIATAALRLRRLRSL